MNNTNKKALCDEDDNVPLNILIKSTLSWDEQRVIEYIRQHPEEKEKLIELLKK